MSPTRARIRSTIASVVDIPDDLRELRRFHKVLADANRLRIVRRLADGPATVTELIEHVGLCRSRSCHGTSASCGRSGSWRRGGRAATRSTRSSRRRSKSFVMRQARALGLDDAAGAGQAAG